MHVLRGLDDGLLDFMQEAAGQGFLTDGSVRQLGYAITSYARWLQDNGFGLWNNAGCEAVGQYLADVTTRSGRSALNTRRWALRKLYAWGGQCGLSQLNIEVCMPPVRGSMPRAPAVLCPSVMERLLRMPDTSTPRGLRDRCALELLHASGLRATELLQLDVADVLGSGTRCFRVVGKGNRERLAVYGHEARDWIVQYSRHVRGQLLAQAGFTPWSTGKLFVSTSCRQATHPQMSYVQLLRMVRRYAAQAGVQATPHTFRHSFATHLYMGGADLRTIQILLGHERLETSSIYVSRRFVNDARLLDRHHPRGGGYVRFERGWRTQCAGLSSESSCRIVS